MTIIIAQVGWATINGHVYTANDYCWIQTSIWWVAAHTYVPICLSCFLKKQNLFIFKLKMRTQKVFIYLAVVVCVQATILGC
jgi:hypothetical protein